MSYVWALLLTRKAHQEQSYIILQTFISYRRNKFYNTRPRANALKLSSSIYAIGIVLFLGYLLFTLT
jgi:hypothetical protein